MHFTWKRLNLSDTACATWQGTCADASQRVRITKGLDGLWRGRLDCGVTQAVHSLSPSVDLDEVKQAAHVAANACRDGRPVSQSDDRIVYLVVTEPGGVDGRDSTAKGGEILLATFDRVEACAQVGRDTRYRLETKVVDVVAAREKLLRKLSALDRLLLAIEPGELKAAPAFGNDLFEGNRG